MPLLLCWLLALLLVASAAAVSCPACPNGPGTCTQVCLSDTQTFQTLTVTGNENVGGNLGVTGTLSGQVATPTPRSLISKLNDVISLADYGAVGDGVTNNYGALSTALASCSNRALLIPAGNYLVTLSATLSIGGQNCKIYGQGKNVSILTINPATSAYYNVFQLNKNNNQFASFTIRYRAFASAQTASLFLVGASNLTMNDMELDGGFAVSAGVASDFSYAFNMANSPALTADYRIVGCDIHNWYTTFLKTNAQTTVQNGWIITGNNFYWNGVGDIGLNCPSGACTSITISNNWVHDPLGYQLLSNPAVIAIGYASGSGVVISSNVIEGNYFFNAIHLEENCTDFVIANNIIRTTGYGITVQANNVSGSFYQPIAGSITGNVLDLQNQAGNAYTGIGVLYSPNSFIAGSNGQTITIGNNIVRGNYSVGMTVGAPAEQGIWLAGNIVDGAYTAYSLLEGTIACSENESRRSQIGLASYKYASVKSHTFENCAQNMANSDGDPIVARQLSFVLPFTQYNTSSIGDWPLLRLGSSDILYGDIWVYFRGNGNNDFATFLYSPVSWDGTTFSAGLMMNLQPGVLASSITLSGGYLSLHYFTAASRSLMAEVIFTGIYSLAGTTSYAGSPAIGTFTVPSLALFAATTATTAARTGGSATALPSQPVIWTQIKVNGTPYYLPLYT